MSARRLSQLWTPTQARLTHQRKQLLSLIDEAQHRRYPPENGRGVSKFRQFFRCRLVVVEGSLTLVVLASGGLSFVSAPSSLVGQRETCKRC